MTSNFVQSNQDFVVTKEYRKFAEFCDACWRHKYIGLCVGPPGVGKTLSTRHYAQTDLVDALYDDLYGFKPSLEYGQEEDPLPRVPSGAAELRTITYTPTVDNTPKQIYGGVQKQRHRLGWVVEGARLIAQNGDLRIDVRMFRRTDSDRHAELLIVDEADRLKMQGLETMRDIYDTKDIGLVLVGMPGLEKRLARYPQLYSRVGFVHEFKPLSIHEVRYILEQKMGSLGVDLNLHDFTDQEAMSAVIRITAGNFRLIHRLFSQIERIMQINELKTVTKEVVEAARENLVIGSM